MEESEPEEEPPRKASRSKKSVRHLAALQQQDIDLPLYSFRLKLPDRVLADLQMYVLGLFYTTVIFGMLTMLAVC